MRSGRAGFGLVELLVATAVLMVGMLLATRLLLEAQVEMRLRTAELSNPSPRYAAERLRADLEGATGVLALSNEWRSAGMRAVAGDGQRVVWREGEQGLERTTVDAEGAVLTRQVLLRELTSWRWRKLTSSLVDVHFSYRVREATGPAVLGSRRSWLPATVEREEWLRIPLRVGE